jgi:hypothetical protein
MTLPKWRIALRNLATFENFVDAQTTAIFAMPAPQPPSSP